MNDRKPRKDGPAVEVVRRPVVPTPGPASAVPTPAAARPVTPSQGSPVAPRAPTPRPIPRVTPGPRPLTTAPGSSPAPRPFGAPTGAGPGRSFGPPRGGPRPPPTVENINALAKRERVPARIAKGELEGKMKCRIWKKLHAEEARRFDQVYTLLETHPDLDLADGFGVVQSGLTVEEFLARKNRTQRRSAVKQARTAVDNAPVDAFLEALRAEGGELAFVLGERTLVDKLTGAEAISFQLERSGKLEKLQVVLLARRAKWEALSPSVERDPRLTQKPVPVAREPERRPHSDPRAFLAHVGETLELTLRNGLRLQALLQEVGRFDLLLELGGEPILVPLHGLLRYERAGQQSA